MKYVCHRLLTGAVLLSVTIAAQAQAPSASTAHAVAPQLTVSPLITDLSRLPPLESHTYGKTVRKPLPVADLDDQARQIALMNHDFRQREAMRVDREGAASNVPRISLEGGPAWAMIPVALGMASIKKFVDPNATRSASGASDLLGGLLGVSTGS